MDRYLTKFILEDLKDKMVFLGGPRQVGKTTLAQNAAPKKRSYLNWDFLEDREFILNGKVPAEKFIIYDEIHKFKHWRNYVKGVYDKWKQQKRILITGSARLDYYRHTGDSLQGRYHYYRLHPLTVKEVGAQTQNDMEDLLQLGGFPEVFLSGSKRKALRWTREYKSRVINEDIPSLEQSPNISLMEALILRLPNLTGSPLSVNSLSRQMQTAHKTVAGWLNIFERMYLIFRISPWTGNLLRAVRKERKHYHYNWTEPKDRGARFENLIACHLLKWVHFQQDYCGRDLNLCYFKDRDKREVDFILAESQKPLQAVECKVRSKAVSPHLKYLKARFPNMDCFQVNLESDEKYISKEGVTLLPWKDFLTRYI